MTLERRLLNSLAADVTQRERGGWLVFPGAQDTQTNQYLETVNPAQTETIDSRRPRVQFGLRICGRSPRPRVLRRRRLLRPPSANIDSRGSAACRRYCCCCNTHVALFVYLLCRKANFAPSTLFDCPLTPEFCSGLCRQLKGFVKTADELECSFSSGGGLCSMFVESHGRSF